jgi:hypothetical protein
MSRQMRIQKTANLCVFHIRDGWAATGADEMIVINNDTTTKRKFVVWKPMMTEDGSAHVSVWFEWMSRSHRDCASFLWVSDDGRRFVEHIDH